MKLILFMYKHIHKSQDFLRKKCFFFKTFVNTIVEYYSLKTTKQFVDIFKAVTDHGFNYYVDFKSDVNELSLMLHHSIFLYSTGVVLIASNCCYKS